MPNGPARKETGAALGTTVALSRRQGTHLLHGAPPTARSAHPYPARLAQPLGWVIVVLGVVVAVVNDLAAFDINLMPGGHNELYLLLALIIAGGGTWFIGLFDPPM